MGIFLAYCVHTYAQCRVLQEQCTHIVHNVHYATLLAHGYTLLEALCGPDCSQGSSQANQLLSPGELEWSEPGEELIDTPLSPILNWNRWTLEHAKEKRRKKTGHWNKHRKKLDSDTGKKQRKKWTLKQRNELILIHDQLLLPLSDVVGGEPIRLMHQVGVHTVHCTT